MVKGEAWCHCFEVKRCAAVVQHCLEGVLSCGRRVVVGSQAALSGEHGLVTLLVGTLLQTKDEVFKSEEGS